MILLHDVTGTLKPAGPVAQIGKIIIYIKYIIIF